MGWHVGHDWGGTYKLQHYKQKYKYKKQTKYENKTDKMPESPEVWFLGLLLDKMHVSNQTYGKHLFLFEKGRECREEDEKSREEEGEDWSFGLSGTVRWDREENRLIKVDNGWICGSIKWFDVVNKCMSSLGIDFMTASQEDVEIMMHLYKWTTSKRTLGTLLLDQSMIAGIGVAWGSEILHHGGLRPDVKACEQDLSTLAASCICIRDQAKATYLAYLEQAKSENNQIDMINGWFHNLYAIRDMQVYQKGCKVHVSGRNWWV